VREPPAELDESGLLDIVRREWDDTVDELQHLPIGFGAHHWAGSAAGQRRLFVTLDRLGPKRNGPQLEDAYAAAAALAGSGLEFVLACLPTAHGGFTVPFGGAAVSATPWVDGEAGDGSFTDPLEAARCAVLLARLHHSAPPSRTPVWRPLVARSFPDELERRLMSPWHTGPYGERARRDVLARLASIRRWTEDYRALTDEAVEARESWVATHGEPDTGNQLATPERRYLVDWESLKLAPAERDLRLFVDLGCREALTGGSLDWRMVEMFDLEWRLDEISQYAAWFAAPHPGSASDAVAYGGLLHELDRPDWSAP
jgi:spectinomycin phosphotransferase